VSLKAAIELILEDRFDDVTRGLSDDVTQEMVEIG